MRERDESEAGSPAWARRTVRGDRVRRACLSAGGQKVQVGFNVVLVLVTTFILVWDIAVLGVNTRPPVWFVVVDCAVVLLLLLEVAARTWERGGCAPYLARGANRFDVVVAVLSALSLALYAVELSRYSGDAETAVFALRVARDAVRFGRVLVFVRSLKESVVQFDPDAADDRLPDEVRELMITPAASPVYFLGGRNYVAASRRPSSRSEGARSPLPPPPEDVL